MEVAMWICPECGGEDCEEHSILTRRSWVCPKCGEEDCEEHGLLYAIDLDEFDDWLDYDDDV